MASTSSTQSALQSTAAVLQNGAYSLGSAIAAQMPSLSGAVDIVVIEQRDGTLKSSPFYVRFGKYQGLMRREREVLVAVNGVEAALRMHMGVHGEAYFLVPDGQPAPGVPVATGVTGDAPAVGQGVAPAPAPLSAVAGALSPDSLLSPPVAYFTSDDAPAVSGGPPASLALTPPPETAADGYAPPTPSCPDQTAGTALSPSLRACPAAASCDDAPPVTSGADDDDGRASFSSARAAAVGLLLGGTPPLSPQRSLSVPNGEGVSGLLPTGLELGGDIHIPPESRGVGDAADHPVAPAAPLQSIEGGLDGGGGSPDNRSRGNTPPPTVGTGPAPGWYRDTPDARLRLTARLALLLARWPGVHEGAAVGGAVGPPTTTAAMVPVAPHPPKEGAGGLSMSLGTLWQRGSDPVAITRASPVTGLRRGGSPTPTPPVPPAPMLALSSCGRQLSADMDSAAAAAAFAAGRVAEGDEVGVTEILAHVMNDPDAAAAGDLVCRLGPPAGPAELYPWSAVAPALLALLSCGPPARLRPFLDVIGGAPPTGEDGAAEAAAAEAAAFSLLIGSPPPPPLVSHPLPQGLRGDAAAAAKVASATVGSGGWRGLWPFRRSGGGPPAGPAAPADGKRIAPEPGRPVGSHGREGSPPTTNGLGSTEGAAPGGPLSPGRGAADAGVGAGAASGYRRTLVPSSEALESLGLRDGRNLVAFSCSTRIWGTQRVEAFVYRWRHDARIVISDVDGTITKSDMLGHILPAVGWDWSHSGVASLFTNIVRNGYHLLFLSARAISQAAITRGYLSNLNQAGDLLPQGPVIISPDGLLPSLYREVIRRRPHDFKIACLGDIRGLFPPDRQPFYAGFGNRASDEISYAAVGVPPGKIFTINPRGEVLCESSKFAKVYTLKAINEIVNSIFPALPPPPVRRPRRPRVIQPSGTVAAAAAPAGLLPTDPPAPTAPLSLLESISARAAILRGDGPGGGMGPGEEWDDDEIAEERPEFNSTNFWRFPPVALDLVDEEAAKKPAAETRSRGRATFL